MAAISRKELEAQIARAYAAGYRKGYDEGYLDAEKKQSGPPYCL